MRTNFAVNILRFFKQKVSGFEMSRAQLLLLLIAQISLMGSSHASLEKVSQLLTLVWAQRCALLSSQIIILGKSVRVLVDDQKVLGR